MLKAIFNWFRQPDPKSLAPAVQPEAAPYKTEAPVQVAPVMEAKPVAETPVEPAKCGCGRSQTGFCVGLHKLTATEWASHPDNPTKPAAAEAVAAKPARKPRATPAAKPATKPAAITAAKKPRGRKPAQK